MHFHLLSSLVILALALVVSANAEKRVFLVQQAEPSAELQKWRKDLIESGIEVLTPDKPTLRRKLHAAWPHSPPLSEPQSIWILLDDLEPGRRYELRTSFSAMQPCNQNFSLPTISEAFANETLVQEINEYLKTRTTRKPTGAVAAPSRADSQQILLNFAIDAWFFTVDKKLMNEGILVEFDFVLDPYLLNILPRSTFPLSIYITILAAIAFPLSNLVWSSLQHVARLETDVKPGDQNKDD